MRCWNDLKPVGHQPGRLEGRKLKTNKQMGPMQAHQRKDEQSIIPEVK